jgi:mannose-6-phosphate isomerase-like protein (cupin superfamily)
MAVALEGGCRVVGWKEGEPVREGDLRIWRHFDAALSLRILELVGETTIHNAEHDEVLYVVEGEGSANGTGLGPDTGIYVPPGQAVQLTGTMTLASSLCRAKPSGRPWSIVRLEDQEVQKTGDRWYRELIRGEVTQFVGSIPPGRSPEHFHLYEEVICILKGTGVAWSGASSTPIAAGSCIFLPRKQFHCLENTGAGEFRLLGTFYPAGSPAVRYGVGQ